MKIYDEKGAALPLVMIAILLGGMIIPAFLGHVGTSLIGSRHYQELLKTQYACDSGAEHALWTLVDGGLADDLPDAGDSISYYLDETINSEDVHVTISNAYETIIWDDFESGGWSGGGGWLDDWSHTADSSASVSTLNSPHGGSYHLRLYNTAYAYRPVDLTNVGYANLHFWAKAVTFGNFDYAYLRVSHDAENWTTVTRWSSSNMTSTYRYCDIPLSGYGLTDEFYIRFDVNTDRDSESFYVDDIEIVWMAIPVITVAEEDFESGDWGGGSGWSGNWTVTGNAAVIQERYIWPLSWYYPHSGDYQAELLGLDTDTYPDIPAGDIMRPVDLSGQSIVRLRFWARQRGFDPSDTVVVRVSSNDGDTWQDVSTLTRTQVTGTWRYFDLDLSGYDLTEDFWIRFDGNHNRDDEYFWLDDITLNAVRAFCITVTAGDLVLRVAVDLLWGEDNILYWVYMS